MKMHNPTPPGEFFKRVYLDELQVSIRKAADHMDVAPSTLSRFCSNKARLTPDLAVRLEAVFGRSAESWMKMQQNHDLWVLEKSKRPKLTPLIAAKAAHA